VKQSGMDIQRLYEYVLTYLSGYVFEVHLFGCAFLMELHILTMSNNLNVIKSEKFSDWAQMGKINSS